MTGEVVSDNMAAMYENYDLSCISPGKFKEWLDSTSKDEDLVLEINSPGGSVTSALAIIDMIARAKSMDRMITARVVGISASAATLICCICDKVEISNTAFFMIHNSMSFALGNKEDIMKTVRTLEKIDRLAVNLYMKHANSGVSRDDIAKAMEEETWLIDDEIKQFFDFTVLEDKDNEEETEKVEASLSKDVIAKYENTPKEILSTLNMNPEEKVEETPEEKVEETPEEKVEITNTAKEILKYIDSLGIILE